MMMAPNNDQTEVIDLVAQSKANPGRRPAWARQSDDLNVNLIALQAGDSIAEHVNAEVDVLIVGVDGEGIVSIDGQPGRLGAGQALLIPKGIRRSIQARSGPFAYLTCHRRRAGLLPQSTVDSPKRL